MKLYDLAGNIWFERRFQLIQGWYPLKESYDCILVMETLIDTLSSSGGKKNATKQ